MRSIYGFLPLLITLFLSVASCKKDDANNNPSIPDYELVNSPQWKTLGKDVIGAGNAGGIQIITLGLNPLSPDLLRWMYAVTTFNYTNEHREMRITPSDEVSILSDFPTPTPKFHLKVMNGGHEWQMNADPNGEHHLWTYKDGVIVDGQYMTDDLPSFPRNQDFLEIASDGFLASGNGGGWQIGHYSFETQKWKRNWIPGLGVCVQTRYGGKTMAVRLQETQVEIYAEGDVESSSEYEKLYLMNLVKNIAIPATNCREITYSVVHGKYLYIAYEYSYMKKLQLYKLNLETLDFSLVQDLDLPARVLTDGFQQKFYDQAIADNANQMIVDEVGNMYLIERNEQKYSIRKYLVSGGSEVVLNNDELKPGTYIMALRYFHSKLYAGVLFQELDQSINTHYYQNYLQLVRMK